MDSIVAPSTATGLATRKATAFMDTPVEIWVIVIEHLLQDFATFTSHPFHPECNLHTALWQWHDIERIRRLDGQRRTLRLVSRSWLNLIDQCFNQYFEAVHCGNFSSQSPRWRTATRLHLGITQNSCECNVRCLCYKYDFARMNKTEVESFGRILQELPADEIFPTNVLMIPFWMWNQVAGQAENDGAIIAFSEVKVLGISGPIRVERLNSFVIQGIPKACPLLTYLRIDFQWLRGSVHPVDYIRLPHLNTLILTFFDLTSRSGVESWDIPDLKHLEITHSEVGTETKNAILLILKTKCLRLINLRLLYKKTLVDLPADFWKWLPVLQYFGATRIFQRGSAIPPGDHPIETLANLDDANYFRARSDLTTYAMRLKNLKTIADSHCWEVISEPITLTDIFQPYFRHLHVRPVCHICITDVYRYCASRGWRYEDCNGRSLNEVSIQ